MPQPEPLLVRGRCACGKRYRIRNAAVGVTVTCPHCQRPITVTDADLRAAMIGERLIPVQEESREVKEAQLVDDAELRMASAGSRPGLTGAKADDHEEAALLRAVAGRDLNLPSELGAGAAGEAARVGRGFLEDLIASFYFAGRPKNVLIVFASAAGCAIVWLAGAVLAGVLPFFGWVLALIANVLVLLYTAHFFWSTMTLTANEDDQLSFAEADWGLWDDAVKPLFWILVISLLCSLPALSLWWFRPDLAARDSPAMWAAIGLGWLFWPVALMSVAIGNTLLFVRPDWLVRCVIGIGPSYLIAWTLAMFALAAYFVVDHFSGYIWFLPGVSLVVEFYLGYVLFRTIGLLFRHHRRRLPWKF